MSFGPGAPVRELPRPGRTRQRDRRQGLATLVASLAPALRRRDGQVLRTIFEEGTRRIVGAQEAKEKRLVTRVVPDAEVASEARAAASRIAEGAPLVARWHKKFARRGARLRRCVTRQHAPRWPLPHPAPRA